MFVLPFATSAQSKSAAVSADTLKPILINESIQDDSLFKYEDITGGEMPKFPGDSLNNYIINNLIVPQDDCNDKIFVRFVVEKDGRLSNLKILHGHCVAMDTAVIKCFRSMPAWIPAQRKGKPVRTSLTVPLIIDLRR